MKMITINVSQSVYARYQDEAARHDSNASELIRDAMNFYLNEKLSKQHSLDSWQPLHLGAVLSDWADNANREEMLNDRY